MLTNETISKLNEMHLGTMAAGFAAQLTDPQFQSLSFEERLIGARLSTPPCQSRYALPQDREQRC